MSDYYESPGALRAAEDRLVMMAKEVEDYRKRIKDMAGDYEAATLRGRIAQINRYDESVQMIIAADPRLQEAWDNFRIQYQLTASKTLLETAREKIAGNVEGVCHGCKRQFPGTHEEQKTLSKANVLRITMLENQISKLEDEITELKGNRHD